MRNAEFEVRCYEENEDMIYREKNIGIIHWCMEAMPVGESCLHEPLRIS